jgi:hypothetical protein
MFRRSIASLACTVIFAATSLALPQSEPGSMPETSAPQGAPAKPSPPATATVSLNGKTITIKYSAPSMRGRKIMGELVPYGKVWRTGANEATSFVTDANLKVGTLSVPAGSYTLFTLPNATQWLLIVNKQTGQWGLTYDETKDLGRTPMKANTLSSPQEKMSISFENTSGNSTVLHIRWENTDQSVQIMAQ